ncbi:MAG: hypothetical protein N3A01_08395 [Bacteroidales bacterium]|nr:hypothetical protein [Bacteroidales bacterium]
MKINPLSFIHGNILFTSEIGIIAEYPINYFSSIQASVNYVCKSPLLSFLEKKAFIQERLKAKGYRIFIEYKYFFYSRNRELIFLDNYYLGLMFSHARADFYPRYKIIYDKYIYASYNSISIKLGYQFSIKRFVFDIYYGAGYKQNVWREYKKQKYTTLDMKILYNLPIKTLLGIYCGYWF